jgi:hypothetical protein
MPNLPTRTYYTIRGSCHASCLVHLYPPPQSPACRAPVVALSVSLSVKEIVLSRHSDGRRSSIENSAFTPFGRNEKCCRRYKKKKIPPFGRQKSAVPPFGRDDKAPSRPSGGTKSAVPPFGRDEKAPSRPLDGDRKAPSRPSGGTKKRCPALRAGHGKKKSAVPTFGFQSNLCPGGRFPPPPSRVFRAPPKSLWRPIFRKKIVPGAQKKSLFAPKLCHTLFAPQALSRLSEKNRTSVPPAKKRFYARKAGKAGKAGEKKELPRLSDFNRTSVPCADSPPPCFSGSPLRISNY